MLAGKGKILVRFKKEIIEKWEREKPLDLSWGRIIVKDYKSFEYEIGLSIEMAEVEAVNSKQKILSPGDKVLISYLVFSQGRYDKGKQPANRLMKHDNGDETYFTYDGTDGWNSSDVYAIVLGNGELHLLPGYMLIDEPKEIQRIGLIHTPKGYKEDREQAFWCTILDMNPGDVLNPDNGEVLFEPGDKVLCAGGLTYEVKTGDKSVFVIRPKYVLAKETKSTVNA